MHIKNVCETGDLLRPAVVMGCVEMVGVGMVIPLGMGIAPPRASIFVTFSDEGADP